MKLRYPLIAILIFGSLWGALAWQNFPSISLYLFLAAEDNQSLALGEVVEFAGIHQALVAHGHCEAAAKFHYLALLADHDVRSYLDLKSIVPGKCRYEHHGNNERIGFILDYEPPVPWESPLRALIAKGNCKQAARLVENIARASDPRIVFYQAGGHDNKSCQNELQGTLAEEYSTEKHILNSRKIPFNSDEFKSGFEQLEERLPYRWRSDYDDSMSKRIASIVYSYWLELTCFGNPDANSPIDYVLIADALGEPLSKFDKLSSFDNWITSCKQEALELAYRYRDGAGVPQSADFYFLWGVYYGPQAIRNNIALEMSLNGLYRFDVATNLLALQNGIPDFDKESFPSLAKIKNVDKLSEFTPQQSDYYRTLVAFSNLYILATERSFAPAQLKLAEFYAVGDWVEQSNMEAYAMLLRAEKNGAKAADLRANLEARLSVDERREIESTLDETEQNEVVETGD